MLHLLNTVSYQVLMLPSMIDEEAKFRKTPEFLSMQLKASKNALMGVIFQTMRSGKRLPMFAPHHCIQPPIPEKADAVA